MKCTQCGADILKTGWWRDEQVRQAYTFRNGKRVKGDAAEISVGMPRCICCDAELPLSGEKAA